jgi:phosphoglycolate phosphatase
MTTLPKPRAILFDWDNTLVNTWPLIHSALNMTLRHMDHPEWTYDRVKNEVKQSMRDSFPALFGERWKEAASHYQKSYRSIHLEELVALSGAEEMLAAIPRDEVFVGIVSNKMGETLRKELAHIGWEKYFDVAVGSSDAARDKPHPEPVHFALKDSGINAAANVWFVGDTTIDLEVAKATGCTPLLYGEVEVKNGEYEGFPVAAHVTDHAGLTALIRKSLA